MSNAPRKYQRIKRSKKVRGKKRKIKNIENYVPIGMYCYGYRNDGKWVQCPFLSFNKNKEYQENGICAAFNMRDDHNGGLLWDMVKECGVNEKHL